MVLENKLGIKSDLELSREEERISKIGAIRMFESGELTAEKAGTFQALAKIHKWLFEEIYDFAGKVRTVNLAKGSFRFASVLYLENALREIEKMSQGNFDQIVEKYVEMNVAHPFREGNGRSTRLWLDQILGQELGKWVGWSLVNKDEYLMAMERSPVRDIEIKHVLGNALVELKNMSLEHRREVFMRGLDASYGFEGYGSFRAKILSEKQVAGKEKYKGDEGFYFRKVV